MSKPVDPLMRKAIVVTAASSLATVLAFVGSLSLLWVTGVSSPRHLAINLMVSYVLLLGLVVRPMLELMNTTCPWEAMSMGKRA